MRLDEDQLFRDDLAERRRARDREREPRKFRRPVPDHHTRQAAAAARIDAVNRSNDTSILCMECPSCLGPVFGRDHGERIDCIECDARLVTHRAIGGELTAILVEEGPDR